MRSGSLVPARIVATWPAARRCFTRFDRMLMRSLPVWAVLVLPCLVSLSSRAPGRSFRGGAPHHVAMSVALARDRLLAKIPAELEPPGREHRRLDHRDPRLIRCLAQRPRHRAPGA